MACNDSDAVANTCNDSSVPVGPCNEGDKTLAIAVSKGKGNIAAAHLTVDNSFPFGDLPGELQNKIIEIGMTAKNREIVFPCLTNAGYKPNITVGLLLVNHRVYHEAHYQLRKQNTFIFGHLGSDLKTVVSSIGPLKCRSGLCGHNSLNSTLDNVTFSLGDEHLPEYANDKLHAFGCALKYLRSEMFISSLNIKFAYHSFNNSAQLSAFASMLRMIKVQDKVIISGDENLLEMSFGDILSSLGMKTMPEESYYWPYDPATRYSPGYFIHKYVPTKLVDKDEHPQYGNLVVGSILDS